MKKLILATLFLLIAFAVISEESKMTFWVYGVDKQITQKYEGLFEVPKFEYMGGLIGGDYVYVVTLITTIVDNDYYCVGIVTDHWFDKIVDIDGYMTATVYDKKQVSLSYQNVILIKVPFEPKR